MTIVDLRTHPEPFVTVQELATYWRIDERSIYRAVWKRSLPAKRVGGVLRIRLEDAQAYERTGVAD